jgi:hypothetical protein
MLNAWPRGTAFRVMSCKGTWGEDLCLKIGSFIKVGPSTRLVPVSSVRKSIWKSTNTSRIFSGNVAKMTISRFRMLDRCYVRDSRPLKALRPFFLVKMSLNYKENLFPRFIIFCSYNYNMVYFCVTATYFETFNSWFRDVSGRKGFEILYLFSCHCTLLSHGSIFLESNDVPSRLTTK